MNETEKLNVVKKLGGWERLVIFSGVILTVPLFLLLGAAGYAVITDRIDAYLGVILSVIALLVLWAVVWGLLWIVSGFRNGDLINDVNLSAKLETLQRENESLKKRLAEIKK